jgi:hypothetical protein
MRLKVPGAPGKKPVDSSQSPPDFFSSVWKSREPPTTDFTALARLHKVSLHYPAIKGFHGRNRYTSRAARLSQCSPFIQCRHHSESDMRFSLTAVNFRQMIFAAFD